MVAVVVAVVVVMVEAAMVEAAMVRRGIRMVSKVGRQGEEKWQEGAGWRL